MGRKVSAVDNSSVPSPDLEDSNVNLPTLIVISGPPGGVGKTTLAHQLARAVGCPAICRDEIKEGMVHSTPGFVPGPGDPLTLRTTPVFFDVLELLLRAGVTVVAESAWQDRVWRPGLERLSGLAHLRIVQCMVEPEVAHARHNRRAAENAVHWAAHGGATELEERLRIHRTFQPVSLPVPTLHVDTSDGYRPGLDEIVAFVNGDAAEA